MIERYKRDTVMTDLKPFCHHAGDDSFIEVTEWYNMEGYDINISSKNRCEMFSLTDGEFQALVHLINAPKHETKVD